MSLLWLWFAIALPGRHDNDVWGRETGRKNQASRKMGKPGGALQCGGLREIHHRVVDAVNHIGKQNGADSADYLDNLTIRETGAAQRFNLFCRQRTVRGDHGFYEFQQRVNVRIFRELATAQLLRLFHAITRHFSC